ncbi:uncharacterized protein LOC129803561 isoform X2 [Phlebotomus papatasi]|uniref:uncharacterized protein LOC129803561 isoform X2 n=1 Tax=Phlebotomus papatasi TaxID=29031 RepID=UPI0024835AB2|nr:uncharacterized protein LOC129803561 isoform X2 [Phlebotomus papatasi]
MKSELDFFLLHHRVFLVKNFYQCNGDYYGVKTKYEINYKDRNDSPKFSCDVLIEVVNLFEETGSVFKPPENTVQTACEQIEQVYIKTEDPEEVLFEDEIEVHNPVKCFFGPPVFEEYNLTQIRDLTRVQNSTSDSNTSNDNTEKAPLIQEIKTEIADEEPKKLHEFCVSCKKSLKRNHTEHHEPDEELSSGSSSRYEGPKPAKVAKKITREEKTKKKNKSYTQEQVKKGLEALRCGKSLGEASTLFGVPKTTLFNKLIKRYPEECTAGRRPRLPKDKEDEIVEWILGCTDKWHPITKDQILDSVQLMCKKFNIVNEFADGRPGYAWFRNFLKRYPQLRHRTLDSRITQTTGVTTKNITEWFEKTREYLESKDLLELPHDRVFSLDETGVMLSPVGDKLMARKGSNIFGKVMASNKKNIVTVLFTISADGKLAPPLLIHKGQKNSSIMTAACNDKGWVMGISEGGSMTSEIFYSYIANSFYNWLLKQNIQFPVILYLDRLAPFITLELSKFCKSKGIELISLYPNATHVMQPLDTSFFSSLEEKYKVTLSQWSSENNGDKLKPRNLIGVLSDALSLLNLEDIAKRGFRGCGLLPFDRNGIDNAKFLTGSKYD